MSPVFPFQRGGLSPPSSSWGRASGLILLKNSVTDVLEILFTQCSLSHVTMSTDMYQSAKSSQCVCVCVCVWDLQWDVKRPVEASVSSQHASLYGSWTQWWLCTKKHNSSVLNEFQVEYRWIKFLLERRAIPDQHGPSSRSLLGASEHVGAKPPNQQAHGSSASPYTPDLPEDIDSIMQSFSLCT